MTLSFRALIFLGLLLVQPLLVSNAADLSGTARTDTLVWQCEVKGNSFTTECRIRRTILNAAGHEFADIALSESPFSKLASFEARIFDAQGRELSHIKKKDLEKSCGYGPSSVLYTDECSYEYEPQVSDCPYTIDYTYSRECSSLFFLYGVELERAIPLTYASISVAYDAKQPIRYKAHHLDAPAVESSGGDRNFVAWTITNLPAGREYTYIPSDWCDGSRVELAPSQFSIQDFKCPDVSWKNLGLFYNQMSAERYLPVPPDVQPPATPEAAHQIADSIYELTVRQTHYVAVTVKLSGWQTEPASKTQVRGYGDCKGLSTLLISRLRGAGITAFPCLVLTSDEGAVDTGFVASAFNHVITMALIGHDTLWFDATTNTCPPGELPHSDEGIFVLVATDTGGVMVKTPIASARNNALFRKTDIAINDSGRTVVSASGILTGHQAQWARWSLQGETHEDVRNFVKEYFVGGNVTNKVDSCTVRKLDSLHFPLELSARIASSKTLDRIGGVAYLFPFMLTYRTSYEGLDLDVRKFPAELLYPYTITDSAIIHSPWTLAADSAKIPASDSVGYPGGFATIRFTRDSTTIVGVFTQVFSEKLIPVGDFPKFSAFLAARKKLLDQPIKWFLKKNH